MRNSAVDKSIPYPMSHSLNASSSDKKRTSQNTSSRAERLALVTNLYNLRLLNANTLVHLAALKPLLTPLYISQPQHPHH